MALMHLVGLNVLTSLERRGLLDAEPEDLAAIRRRFFLYRGVLWSATLGSAAVLALWLTKVIA